MAMHRRCGALLVLAISLGAQTTSSEITADAVWSPDDAVLDSIRKQCSSSRPAAMVSCFADAMARAGASRTAVAFTRRHSDVVYIRELQEAGTVDIAAVERPFRANDTQGLLLAGGSPAEIDVDDLSRLPQRELQRDEEYAQVLSAHPKAMLLPAGRTSGSVADLELLADGGQRFTLAYRVADGCRACATLGYSYFRFDFNSTGHFQGIRFVRFSSIGPEGEETSRAAPSPLEMSSAPKLIQLIYQATRETKEARTPQALREAKLLVEQGQNLRAVDAQKRTALHWVVFGSAAETKPKALAAYEELAAALIDAGVDVNYEDQYQNTGLDYLDYSPNQVMQSLLMEHGAVSGFFTGDIEERFVDLFRRMEKAAGENSVESVRQVLQADLTPGQTISVRLLTPVSTQRSWTGDPVRAVVTAPLTTRDRVVLAPGTELEGTVYYSETAANEYSQPRLVLDFANVVHSSGARSPLFARVTSVDNARETVRHNEIIGILQPHASSKVSMGLRLAGFAHPGVGWAITGMRTVYGRSIHREIDYPEGTDLVLQVTGPAKLREIPDWPGWRTLPLDAELDRLVQRSPLRAMAGQKPSDLTNLMFLGSREELVRAFANAGWLDAERVTVKSGLKAFQATIRQSGYEQAPMSLLTIEGQAPDFEMQKGLNTFARRHHLRIWKQPGQYRGRDIWISSSTHDIGIGVEKGTKWFHRIDPRIDRERTKVQTDLLFTGGASAYALVERRRAPRKTENATGDALLTDGRMLVLSLADGEVSPSPRNDP